MAINSGVAWSVKFLKKIGGFNPAFSLDFLDHWLFWKVDQLEKTVEILPVRMEHDLSVLDYEKFQVIDTVLFYKQKIDFIMNMIKGIYPVTDDNYC